MVDLSFKTLAQDLLSLEINTIIKADMSGRKMPTDRREALLDISKKYHLKLVELGYRKPEIWNSGGVMAFLELRSRAIQGRKQLEIQINQSSAQQQKQLKQDLVMLMRILGQSEQIISLFVNLALKIDPDFNLITHRQQMNQQVKQDPKHRPYDEQNHYWNNDLSRHSMQKYPDLELDAAQISLIRKIWEIGTEQVMLQTVIHADGDVTTRIAEHLTENPNETLFQVHNQAVQNSVKFWQGLVELVTGMAKSLFKSRIP